jgi:phytoene dehydrogenase-like protein
MIDLSELKDIKAKQKIEQKQSQVKPLKGGDSIQAVFIASDLGPEYFDKLCTGHFFYTPIKKGLKEVMEKQHNLDYTSKEQLFDWLKEYYKYTTYEIAIPGLRDDSLSPKGKTGLVVSTLMDYEITKAVAKLGFYDEYKKLSEDLIVEALNNSIFPKLEESIIFKFSSSPLTIENRTNNSNGAITGWAFTNKTMPAVTSMPGIAKSVLTPIPDVFQAGQWSYSPSGLPISILTGKLASDKVKKTLKKV